MRAQERMNNAARMLRANLARGMQARWPLTHPEVGVTEERLDDQAERQVEIGDMPYLFAKAVMMIALAMSLILPTVAHAN